MQKNPTQIPGAFEKSDWREEIAAWLGSKMLLIGAILLGICTLAMIYTAHNFTENPVTAKDALGVEPILHTFRIGLFAGAVIFAIGVTLNFWGDIALGLTLGLAAALYFFAPQLLPYTGFIGEPRFAEAERVTFFALNSLRISGMILGAFAIVIQLADAVVRIRDRSKYGTREEQLQYGKGTREEADFQNRLLGKCWQLPYCRKFVREKCPIYHSRRTCWKERVGCMCEEEVIRGAMDNKAIPRDAVAAAKYIPYNPRITPQQKAERCRQCVIYNEHQRHKYKVAVPLAVASVMFVYVAFNQPLLEWTQRWVSDFDRAMSKFTYSTHTRVNPEDKTQAVYAAEKRLKEERLRDPESEAVKQAEKDLEAARALGDGKPTMMEQMILFLVMLFVLSQIMRVVEYSIFKLKI